MPRHQFRVGSGIGPRLSQAGECNSSLQSLLSSALLYYNHDDWDSASCGLTVLICYYRNPKSKGFKILYIFWWKMTTAFILKEKIWRQSRHCTRHTKQRCCLYCDLSLLKNRTLTLNQLKITADSSKEHLLSKAYNITKIHYEKVSIH